MIYLITCKDYSVVATLPYDFPVRLLPQVCAAYEEMRSDGYAVIARRDGKTVSDSEMVFEDGYYVDHATQTGMYDHF